MPLIVRNGMSGLVKILAPSGIPLSELPEGALVKLNEDGVGVNFYVAKHDYESDLNGYGRTCLLRKDIHSKRRFAEYAASEAIFPGSIIDTWLNDEYKTLLDIKIQDAISTTTFYCTDSNRSLITISRSVFLPSQREITNHPVGTSLVDGTLFPARKTFHVSYYQEELCKYWTRSAWTGVTPIVEVATLGPNVTDNGMDTWVKAAFVDATSYTGATHGVRPCFSLPSSLMVSKTQNSDGSYTML